MINKINKWEFKLSAYRYALSTISFDSLTIAPKDGVNYRNERHSYLSGEYYKLLVDEEIYNILQKLKEDKTLNKIDKRKVNLYLKTFEDTKALSEEEYIEFNKLKLQSGDVWEKAREKSDYKLFEPYLKKLIIFSKKIAKNRNFNVKAYDLFLDDYEEGMNIEKYDEFFNLIKERIIPLVKKVVKNNHKVDSKILNGKYEINKQTSFNKKIMEYLCFNSSWSYFTTSVHPFTSGISKNDVRITTRYDENDLLYSLFSTIHEIGHGMFEHQILDKFDGSIISSGITSGIHESQSRLFENYLCKNKSFWDYNFKVLQDEFTHLKKVDINSFIKAINASKPSFIRTEADELTYPLHILVRYEIEKGIFDETISIDNLDKTWNDKMYEYLGVNVLNDKEGILQDIHWSDASFGYFPAYALGSAYAAQIYYAMQKDLDLDDLLKNNKFEDINVWLKEKIHSNGALLTPEEIIVNATKEKFNPMYYIEYLEDKFSKLYDLL